MPCSACGCSRPGHSRSGGEAGAARLRHETRALVYPAEPGPLGRRLAAVRGRPNLNLLGEAILGWQEAERRTAAVDELLPRDDVDCVSVKVSSVAAGLSLVDFEGSVARITGPLRHLYRSGRGRRSGQARQPGHGGAPGSRPHGGVLHPGPGRRRVRIAHRRHRSAGLSAGLARGARPAPRLRPPTPGERRRAPIRIRLVKGANLAMENVDGRAPRLARRPLSDQGRHRRLVRAGSSNAWWTRRRGHGARRGGVAQPLRRGSRSVLSEQTGAAVDIEMLAGMADNQAAAVAERSGRLLLLRSGHHPSGLPQRVWPTWRAASTRTPPRRASSTTCWTWCPGSRRRAEQADRFARSVRARDHVTTERLQRQDRLAEAVVSRARPGAGARVRSIRRDGQTARSRDGGGAGGCGAGHGCRAGLGSGTRLRQRTPYGSSPSRQPLLGLNHAGPAPTPPTGAGDGDRACEYRGRGGSRSPTAQTAAGGWETPRRAAIER